MGRAADLSTWLAGGALALAGVAACNATQAAGPRACSVSIPAGWPSEDLRWSGPCPGGVAEGRGVVRAYADGRVVRIFYGRLRAGRLDLGAVELEGGYAAGRFDDQGRAISDGDRDTLILAFDEASAAARGMAQRMRSQGNETSARFYADRARRLAQQMD